MILTRDELFKSLELRMVDLGPNCPKCIFVSPECFFRIFKQRFNDECLHLHFRISFTTFSVYTSNLIKNDNIYYLANNEEEFNRMIHNEGFNKKLEDIINEN